MSNVQKRISLDELHLNAFADGADMSATATLKIGNITYSYLTINAVISDDLKLKIIGLVERELGRCLDAEPDTLPKSPVHKQLENA